MENLANNIQNAAKKLLAVVSTFPEAEFNSVPFEGSWTVGQVADHVLKSCSAILKAVNGNTTTTSRDPQQYVQVIREAFLNFDQKMKSPDFIIPSDDYLNQQELLTKLKIALDGISDTARNKDLNATCIDFEMPGMGHLTRTELINFVDVHTQRHINQLHQIEASLAD